MTQTGSSLLDQNQWVERWLLAYPEWQGETSMEGRHYLRMSKQARYAFLCWMFEQKKGYTNLGIEREREELRKAIIAEGGRFDPRANVDPDSAFGKLYDYLLDKGVACPFKVFDNGTWGMYVPLAQTLQVLGYVPPSSSRWYGDCCSGDPLRSLERRKLKIRGRMVVVVSIRDLLLRISDCCKCSLVKPAAQEVRQLLKEADME